MKLLLKVLLYLVVISQVVLAQTENDLGPTQIEWAYIPAIAADTIGEDTTLPISYFLDLQDAKRRNGPLGFTVHPWPMDLNVVMNGKNQLIIIELTSILGSIGVNDRLYKTVESLEYIAGIAWRARAGVVLHTSPFHRTGCRPDPDDWSRTSEEIQLLQDYLERAKCVFEPRGVPILAMIFDFECYDVVHPNVTARMNLVYAVAKGVLPSTTLIWYRSGDYGPNLQADRDNRTVIAYRPYRAPYTELWIERWKVKTGDTVSDWTWWTSIGACYGNEHHWTWTCPEMLDDGKPGQKYISMGRLSKALEQDIILYPPPYRTFMPNFHEAFLKWYEGATSK